jgi:hypothetical protein
VIEGDITTSGTPLLSADCHFYILRFKTLEQRPRAAPRYNQA